MTFDAEKYLQAQQEDYSTALAEIKKGRKTTHWIWYIFPQIAGLGHSHMSRHYALKDLQEARAYLQHPVLGARLQEITKSLLAHRTKPIQQIMGHPDDVKLRSCLTLFARAAGAGNHVFAEALNAFYNGTEDAATLEKIAKQP